jgi:hypothetical protein
MDDTSTKLTYKSISFAIQFLCYCWVVGAAMFLVIPLYSQAISWLKHGFSPERDLFWLLSDVSCAATNFEPKGFEGMDLCRSSYIIFTDWVGVNQVMNWFCDFHVSVFFIAASVGFYWVIFWLESKAKTKAYG